MTAAPRFPPNIEASLAWDRLQYELARRPPHPDAIVRARPIEAEALPGSPALLLRVAREAGWLVRPTFARGYRVGARGEPAGRACSIALRCHRGAERILGIWVRVDKAASPRWVYELGFAWRAGVRGMRRCTAAELKGVLRAAA